MFDDHSTPAHHKPDRRMLARDTEALARTLLRDLSRDDRPGDLGAVLRDIAGVAATLTTVLDRIRTEDVVTDSLLAGPDRTRITLDQAAAAAADLQDLTSSLVDDVERSAGTRRDQ